MTTQVHFAENGFFLITEKSEELSLSDLGIPTPSGMYLDGPQAGAMAAAAASLKRAVPSVSVIRKDKDLLDALRAALEVQEEFVGSSAPQMPSFRSHGTGDCDKQITITRYDDGFGVKLVAPVPQAKVQEAFDKVQDPEAWKWRDAVNSVIHLVGTRFTQGAGQMFAFNEVDEVIDFVEKEILIWSVRNGAPAQQ